MKIKIFYFLVIFPLIGILFISCPDGSSNIPPQSLEAPSFSTRGLIFSPTQVEITTNIDDATIYYTVDNTNPSSSSNIYKNPINVDKSMTLKAFAIKSGFTPTAITSANYKMSEKLTPGDIANGSNFGSSLSLDGNFAIVGVPEANNQGAKSGCVYIYEKNSNGKWDSVIKIDNPSTERDDKFGTSVSIFEETAVISAPNHNTNKGCVYIYKKISNSNWEKVEKIDNPNTNSDNIDYFGSSVYISGDNIIIGAINAKNNKQVRSGIAYIYSLKSNNNNNELNLLSILNPEDGKNDDYFGCSVAINDNYAVVGANQQSSAGYVYIYAYDNSKKKWDLTGTKLTDETADQSDDFGDSVDISGEIVIIGSKMSPSDNNEMTGAAFIYQKNGKNGSWVLDTKLVADDKKSNDYFGTSVSIDNNYAIVGSNRYRFGENYSGAAYLFKYQNSNWIQEAMYILDNTNDIDSFSSSATIDNKTILVGAPSSSYSTTSGGNAYIFEYDD